MWELSVVDAIQMVLLASVIEGLLQTPTSPVLQVSVSCINCQVTSVSRALLDPFHTMV